MQIKRVYARKVDGGHRSQRAVDLLHLSCQHPAPPLSHQPTVRAPGTRTRRVSSHLCRLLGCSVHQRRRSVSSLDGVRGWSVAATRTSRVKQLIRRHQTIPDGQCRHRWSATSNSSSSDSLCRLLDAMRRVPTRRSSRLQATEWRPRP